MVRNGFAILILFGFIWLPMESPPELSSPRQSPVPVCQVRLRVRARLGAPWGGEGVPAMAGGQW